MWSKHKTYLISILIALGIGGLSTFFIRNNLFLYQILNKPVFAPPKAM